jgi:uroporphyrinogen-III synthase
MNESNSDGERTWNVPVLLLKTKSTPHDRYEEHFSAKGRGGKWSYEPMFVPVLEHRFQEKALSTVTELLKNKEISKNAGARYGGLIFTSQRAVEAFARVVEDGMFITLPICRGNSFIDYST